MKSFYLYGVIGLVAFGAGCNKQKDAEAPSHEEGVQASVDWQLGKKASAEGEVGRTTFEATDPESGATEGPAALPDSGLPEAASPTLLLTYWGEKGLEEIGSGDLVPLHRGQMVFLHMEAPGGLQVEGPFDLEKRARLTVLRFQGARGETPVSLTVSGSSLHFKVVEQS
jgi:hypothetical protein